MYDIQILRPIIMIPTFFILLLVELVLMSEVHRLALHIFIASVLITRILDPPHVRVTMPYSGKCFECDIC